MGSRVFWFPKRAYNSVNANFLSAATVPHHAQVQLVVRWWISAILFPAFEFCQLLHI